MGQFDHFRDHGMAGLVVDEIGGEGPVDLEDVDRELLEVAQRRVAGAEIVEGEEHPELLEVGQHDQGPLGILDEGALGDLQA